VEIPVTTTLPTVILAHEFLDALPTHQFKMTTEGWREIMVDVDDSPLMFRFVLSSRPTQASQILTAFAPADSKMDDVWEMSPDMMRVVKQCHDLIGNAGAFLAVDYGSATGTMEPTLRVHIPCLYDYERVFGIMHLCIR
jgi:NADH dehydrogenase [ubiquinone] 1 alpha subcomplex assembly factor 7